MASRPTFAVLGALFSLLGPAAAQAVPGSVEFFLNGPGSQNQDHGRQLVIPPGFGDGEFTLELWIRPNDSFPVGTVLGGTEQRTNWASDDNAPYSSGSWWYKGNFLLDGHNNNSGFALGTFSLQFYGGGRVRWLFGDGSGSIPDGSLWSVGAYPATSTPSLLDGQWHQVTLVRRCPGGSSAQLELWIDGVQVDTESSNVCTNMRQWWDGWSGFGGAQSGWFWAAEKQAVVGVLDQYEDYKGLVDELRFWSRAKSGAEIAANYADPVTGTEPGLVGYYPFAEAQGTDICDSLAASRCIVLGNVGPNPWSADNAPLSSAGDTTAPSRPENLQATAISASRVDLTWTASTDNVGVTGYTVSRDGSVIDNASGPGYSDTTVAAGTTYSYSVSARDAAGNVSPESSPASVTTPSSSDTEAPTAPTGLAGNAVSPSRIDLTWNASSDNVGVTGYRVSRDGNVVATVGGTSHSDTGLAANTGYVYTVTARDAAGNESPPSAPASLSTPPSNDTQPPTAPTGLSASAVSASRVDLSWNPASDDVGVAEYEIRRNGAAIAVSTTTRYTDSGLAADTLYTYTVVASDAAGNRSQASAAASVRTPAANGNSSGGGGGAIGGTECLLLLLTLALGVRARQVTSVPVRPGPHRNRR